MYMYVYIYTHICIYIYIYMMNGLHLGQVVHLHITDADVTRTIAAFTSVAHTADTGAAHKKQRVDY